jgi:hypothetical protein
MASILGWDVALAFVGNLGNLYGLTRGIVTTLAGVATLSPSLLASGISQFGWALVPRYGWWSGPGWGQPNLDALGYWYGPYSRENVIEYATYWHDQYAKYPEPIASWSRTCGVATTSDPMASSIARA